MNKTKDGSRFYILTLFIIIVSYSICIVFAGDLNVPLCPQQKTQWCWAASSEAIIKYYGTNVTQTQCAKIITTNNSPQPMSAIKKILDKYKVENVYQGSHTFTAQEMKQEIDKKHPFCIFWHWNNGGGHFVDVTGYNGDIFTMMNPWPPNKGEWNKGSYNYVKNAQNKGYWRGTVWTLNTPTVINQHNKNSSPNTFTLTGKNGMLHFHSTVADITSGTVVIYNVQGCQVMKKRITPDEMNTLWNLHDDHTARISAGSYLSVFTYTDSRHTVHSLKKMFVLF